MNKFICFAVTFLVLLQYINSLPFGGLLTKNIDYFE